MKKAKFEFILSVGDGLVVALMCDDQIHAWFVCTKQNQDLYAFMDCAYDCVEIPRTTKLSGKTYCGTISINSKHGTDGYAHLLNNLRKTSGLKVGVLGLSSALKDFDMHMVHLS